MPIYKCMYVMISYKEGHDLTPEEQKLYDDYKEIWRGVSKRQYEKRKVAAALVEKPSISVTGAMKMTVIIGITSKNAKLKW